ncbi:MULTISPECIES: YhdP family protein [Candidatus Ichthyocystis]|uniref:Putative membrane protein, AsmA Domain n=1 Tax=Candidatus Ichthyocystis hellenicum TaxID=1561003 RepID=A0A0S4M1E9_9BURK|nr:MULTISPECIES: AsmA-like C-terminal region-containing protein [Ichthyocystis]CUT17518.1 putative membrane protein, AsmA Domain [Candidatus Ichthyocystis hellenicum]
MNSYFWNNKKLFVVVSVFVCLLTLVIAGWLARSKVESIESTWGNKSIVLGGYKFSFSSLNLSLLAVSPYLTVSGVSISSNVDKLKRIYIPEAVVYVSWWNLLRGKFFPNSVDVANISLDVIHKGDVFIINNFVLDDVLSVLGNSSSLVDGDVFQSIREFSLRGLNISWLEGGRKKAIKLVDVAFRALRVSSNRIRFVVNSLQPTEYYRAAFVSGYVFYGNHKIKLDSHIDFSLERLDIKVCRLVFPYVLTSMGYSGSVDFFGQIIIGENVPKAVKGKIVVHNIKLTDQHAYWFAPYLSMDVDLSWGDVFSGLKISNIRDQRVSFDRLYSNSQVSVKWAQPFSLDNIRDLEVSSARVSIYPLKNILLLISRNFFPEYDSVIHKFPNGVINDFTFDWRRPYGRSVRPFWQVKATVSGSSSGGFFWVRRFKKYKATITGNQDYGHLDFDDAVIQLDLHTFLRHVRKWKTTASGRFFWKFYPDKNKTCLGAESLYLKTLPVKFEGHFESCPLKNNDVYSTKFVGKIFPKSLVFFRDHLPDVVSPNVRRWIAKSFIAGSIPSADINFSGDFDLGGIFFRVSNWSLGINLSDTHLSLGEGLDFLHINGVASVNNRTLEASGSGIFGTVPIKGFHLLINDFHADDFNSNVLLQAKTAESNVSAYADALLRLSKVFTISPAFLENFNSPDFLGKLRIQNMMLSIPLWSSADRISYAVYLVGEDLRKNFTYRGSVYHLVADNAYAGVCNGSYFVNFDSLLASPKFSGKGYIQGDSTGDFSFSAVSKDDIHSLLKDVLDINLPSVYLNGVFKANIDGYVADKVWNVHIGSDMAGIFSSLPKPFYKKVRDAKWPVSISYTKDSQQSLLDVFLERADTRLMMRYGNSSSIYSQLDDQLAADKVSKVTSVYSQHTQGKGNFSVPSGSSVKSKFDSNLSGDIAGKLPHDLGNDNHDVGSVSLLGREGVGKSSNDHNFSYSKDSDRDHLVWIVSIDTPLIDENKWISLVHAGVFGHSLRGVPSQLSIVSKRVKFGFLSIDDVVAHIVSDGKKIISQIISPNLSGVVKWNKDEHQLSIRLDSASVFDGVDHESDNVDQAIFGWPNIDLSIQSFKFRGIPIGSVKLQMVNQDNTSDIQLFAIQNEDALIEVKGQLKMLNGVQVNKVTFQSIFYNMGNLLSLWKQKPIIDGGSGVLHGSLDWEGSLLFWRSPVISGVINLDLSKGEFRQVNPGVGRLLGLFSLQALPRRVLLDFHDVFSSGFSFDSLKGLVQVNNGILTIQDMDVRGPSSQVVVSGVTSLLDHTFDMDFCVFPQVSNTFSVASVLAGFPVAGVISWVAQSIFRDPIGNLLTRSYKVVGNWSDPVIEKVGERCSVSQTLRR